jgi:hypothetical protein
MDIQMRINCVCDHFLTLEVATDPLALRLRLNAFHQLRNPVNPWTSDWK